MRVSERSLCPPRNGVHDGLVHREHGRGSEAGGHGHVLVLSLLLRVLASARSLVIVGCPGRALVPLLALVARGVRRCVRVLNVVVHLVEVLARQRERPPLVARPVRRDGRLTLDVVRLERQRRRPRLERSAVVRRREARRRGGSIRVGVRRTCGCRRRCGRLRRVEERRQRPVAGSSSGQRP